MSFKFRDEYKNELSYNYSPIEKVGVYVPGGTASYPSTVLMNCIPAIVAGVKNIYLTTPSMGTAVNPAIIYGKKIKRKSIKQEELTLSQLRAYGTKTFK